MIRFPFFYFERKKFHEERIERHEIAVVEERREDGYFMRFGIEKELGKSKGECLSNSDGSLRFASRNLYLEFRILGNECKKLDFYIALMFFELCRNEIKKYIMNASRHSSAVDERYFVHRIFAGDKYDLSIGEFLGFARKIFEDSGYLESVYCAVYIDFLSYFLLKKGFRTLRLQYQFSLKLP